MIWALVAAAGESRRMGVQKLLLPFGASTVVGTVVDAALSSRVDGTLVVVGADRAGVRRALAGRPVRIAANPRYRDGMLSSIQAGVRALPAGATAVVVMLGDQPALPAAVIDRVVRAYGSGGAGIVVPTHGGRRGHPALVDLKYRGEVLALDPRVGLRALLRAHAGDVREVPVRSAAILRDLDVPEDYARERGRRRAAP